MLGFEETSILLPAANGLGYASEQKIERTQAETAAGIASSSSDLTAIRAAKRRAEIEAMSMPRGGDDAGDIDAAAARKHAAGGSTAATGRISLREQLRINLEAKNAAWQEKHNLIRAPAGMSEEDYNAFEELNEYDRAQDRARKEREQIELEAFERAVREKELREKNAKPLDQEENDTATSSSSSTAASTAASAASRVAALPDIAPELSFGVPHAATASLAPESSNSLAVASLSSSIVSSSTSTMPVLVVLKRKSDHVSSKHEKKKHNKKQKQEKSDTPSKEVVETATSSAAQSNSDASASTTSASASSDSGSALTSLLGAYQSDEDD